MIFLATPNLTGNERKYLNECIDTTFVSSVGKFVTDIEQITAEKSGTKYGVATSSGTTGLHLALTACGVQSGDIVIIPTFTFIATANAVAHCHATPWLMDISKDSWTLDAQQLKEELEMHTFQKDDMLFHKETGKRVAAIMPVYTLGNVPDMDAICKIAAHYHLPVIADAAAALGATYKGKKVGEPADLTVFSFNGNKTITAGGGGMVVGNDQQLMQKLKHLSTTARVTAEYDHDMVGFNYRMTNIQAAVGCAQLERLEEFVEKKQEIRRYYNEHLKDIATIEFFPDPENQTSACWFSGIVLKNGNLDQVREICKALAEQGIEARSFWKPVHLQKPYADAIMASSLKTADELWCRIITLPCSTHITNDELGIVVSTLKKILSA